jgi:hypothetical protein
VIGGAVQDAIDARIGALFDDSEPRPERATES